jgi:hypothetical protein
MISPRCGRDGKATRRLDAAILAAIDDGTILIGSVGSLAKSLGTTCAELRLELRALLEARKIVVRAHPDGQLAIRLERRLLEATPALPPCTERRRPNTDIWIL